MGKFFKKNNKGETTFLGAITDIEIQPSSLSNALLIFRIVVAGFMMKHGIDKLVNYQDISQSFFDPFGLGVELTLNATIFVEVFFSAFILIGLFTRVALFPLIIQMLLAIFFVHIKNNDFLDSPSSHSAEEASLYLVSFIMLFVLGPGKVSIDRYIQKTKLNNKTFFDNLEETE